MFSCGTAAERYRRVERGHHLVRMCPIFTFLKKEGSIEKKRDGERKS